jgi:hypothetical protein
MPVVDKDYIVRVIKQIADLFARIVKLIEKREYDTALRVVQDACPKLVGFDYAPLAFADAESAAKLLVDKDKVKIFAQLVQKEAELLELKGDDSAADKRRFAAQLWAEALGRNAVADPAQADALRALVERVGPEALSDRHRGALSQVMGHA